MEQLIGRRIATLLLLGIVVAALPWLTPASSLPGITHIVVIAGAAMTANLLIGNAGLISMGHGLFIGLGAYVVGICNVKYGIPLGWGALAALGVSLIVGAITGGIALRARALFFALLTLAISQVAYVIAARNYDLTGGDDGLVGIDVPAWLDGDTAKHLFAVGVTTGVCFVLLVLLASPFGATLRAVRDNRDRVASLGGNPIFFEFAAYVIAGLLGTIMGIVAVTTQQSVEPAVFSWTTGATLLVMVALGGRFTFFGPIVGVLILELTRTYIQKYSDHGDLVIGLLVVLCAVTFPDGIVSRLEAWFAVSKVKRLVR